MSQKTAKRLRRLEAQQQHQMEMYIKVVNHMMQLCYKVDSIAQKRDDNTKGDKTMGFAFKCKYCGAIAHTRRRWFVRCIVCGKLHLTARSER